MDLNNFIAAMMISLRKKEHKVNIIDRPAKHPKPHRDHAEAKISNRERKNRQRIRNLSRKKRRD